MPTQEKTYDDKTLTEVGKNVIDAINEMVSSYGTISMPFEIPIELNPKTDYYEQEIKIRDGLIDFMLQHMTPKDVAWMFEFFSEDKNDFALVIRAIEELENNYLIGDELFDKVLKILKNDGKHDIVNMALTEKKDLT